MPDHDQPSAFTWCLTGLLLWIGFFAGWSVTTMPLAALAAPFAAVHLGWIGGLAGAGAGWRARRPLAAALRPLPRPPLRLRPEGRAGWALVIAGGLGVPLAAAVFVKTGNAVLSKVQRIWRDAWLDRQGVYSLARFSDTEDGAATIMQALRGWPDNGDTAP